MEKNIDIVKEILNKTKGSVCKEFEKICPTDKSFERIKKDMHDIFDQALADIKQNAR